MIAVYATWYFAVSRKSGEVVGLQDKITAASESLGRIASARSALTKISDDEKEIQSYFVSESGIVTFIAGLEARGLAEGAAVSVLSVSKGDSNKLPTLLLTLTIKGKFDAVMRTIGTIEYAPYDISISTLTVGHDSADSWKADLGVTVGSVPVDNQHVQ